MMNKNLSSIKLIAFDFDGVFTDNSVFVSEKGEELVRCYRGDGIGLARLKDIGIKTVVISSEANAVVKRRCEKMVVNYIYDCKDKLSVLKEIISRNNISIKDVCFMGNDINDLECMKNAGVSIAVADAFPEVIEIADIVTEKKGGYGAVREVCDLIYSAKKDC